MPYAVTVDEGRAIGVQGMGNEQDFRFRRVGLEAVTISEDGEGTLGVQCHHLPGSGQLGMAGREEGVSQTILAVVYQRESQVRRCCYSCFLGKMCDTMRERG